MKRHIPNIITCCNLLSGAMAVMLAFEGLYICAFGCIMIGACFDFFDGMTARILGVSGPIGKELDSLADVITFGLAPSAMLVQSVRQATENSNYEWGWWSMVFFIMAAFSAVRLARFNCDERQTDSFIGLATPANALFWASLITTYPDMASWAMWMPWAMLAACLISCYLLVAELPMFSLKFHNLSWTDNKTQYMFIIGCVAIVALCTALGHFIASGALIIVWYIVANLMLLAKNK
ncbi:MAG: CDP-alcohol phosphatidyltransferase family protein [Paludibacteraceae bacterium]|nr:CDP-alcohol phosphatidyltransferase family protein [Paludibacteraceae bacterium]